MSSRSSCLSINISPHANRCAQFFSAFLVYVIITWNCGNLGWYGWYTANEVRWAVRLFHLDQVCAGGILF